MRTVSIEDVCEVILSGAENFFESHDGQHR